MSVYYGNKTKSVNGYNKTSRMPSGILTLKNALIIHGSGTTIKTVHKLFNCLPIPENFRLVTTGLV